MLEKNADSVRSKINSIFERYEIDKTELGKILAVSSLAVLLISIPSALELKNSYEEIEELNQDLDSLRGVMETENFQQSMESIETTLADSDMPGAGEFRQLHNSFGQMNQSINRLETMEERLESSYEAQQWVILTSILGIITGLALIYV